MKKAEARAAAEVLRQILVQLQKGELTASPRVAARLEGARIALEAAAQRRSTAR